MAIIQDPTTEVPALAVTEDYRLEPVPDPSTVPPTPLGRAMPTPAGPGSSGFSGETRSLRRRRLAAAALFLAGAYGAMLIWKVAAHWGDHIVPPAIWALVVARWALPTGVAVWLAGRSRMSPAVLRLTEYALFGGITAALVVMECVVTAILADRGDLLALVGFLKNVVIEDFALMVLYGTFIPNAPRTTAKVTLTMALAPMIGLLVVTEDPRFVDALDQLRRTDLLGCNAMFLLIGAALATYGAHVLNGLRTELHEARKFGQYRLVRKLGEGGMGEVYLAEHELLKRPCALKLIRSGSVADPIASARFAREVHSAAQLSHPNTVAIYDYGHTEGGTFYYVMEYLPGLGLDELVGRHGPLPAGRVVHLLRQACGALAEAHGLGLIHRDLKPANLFVARRGGEADVAKILDFGLVKRTREPADSQADGLGVELTAEHSVSGTPAFMAPEQATGAGNLDARADLYALGAVAYFALTGRPPFTGANAFAVMMAHARDPVIPPSSLRPEVPADLEAVVLTCLAKAPADRFADARALAKALDACDSADDWGADHAERWWADLTHSPVAASAR